MKFGLVRTLIGALILATTVAKTFGQEEQPVRPKWEYKKLTPCSEADRKLDWNKLGEEGWEFFLYEPEIATSHASKCAVYHFKRIKPDAPPAATIPNGKCSVTVEKSPSIRGLRLGVKLDELLTSFPTYAEDTQVQHSLKSRLPSELLHLTFHRNNKTFKEPIFEGVWSFSFTLMDDIVIGISVSFLGSSEQSPMALPVDELANQLIEKFGLPSLSSWQVGQEKGQRILGCQGFELTVVSQLAGFSGGVLMLPSFQSAITVRIPKTEFEQRMKSKRGSFKW